MTGSGSLPESRGRPLAMRLAVMLAIAVAAVLLLTGVVVNRAVNESLTAELTRAQRTRMQIAVTALEQLQSGDLPRGERHVGRLLHGIAGVTGGHVRLLDASGAVIAEAGHHAGDGQRLTERLTGDAGGGTLEVTLPAAESEFLAVFNRVLLVGGAASVLAIVGTGWLIARRVTRPLRGLAAAAHRLGDGDLATRAAGGPDRESIELAGAFNAMAARIERSEMLRRRAASDVAHDLATPATVLESQLQAMLDGVVPADRRELERARASASALSGVVRQLGDLAGAEAAVLQRRAEDLPLRPLTERVIASLDALLRDRSVSASVEGEASAHTDPAQVERALRNVVANAAQHARGRVGVRIGSAGGEAQIRVVDDGPGIPEADLPHVFERFYRADPSRSASRHSGSGLGLTIARELLLTNDGAIEVERTGADGTTVLLRMPLAR
jgi:two-component system sensor histidine kinase BaeS